MVLARFFLVSLIEHELITTRPSVPPFSRLELEEKHTIISEDRVNIIDVAPVEAAQSGPDNGVDGGPTKDGEAVGHVKQDSQGKLKPTYG
jgi:hypothetical protein